MLIPTHPPTTTAHNYYYDALETDVNNHSDDETVVMTNRTDENQKGKYAPVNAAYSVWGSDEDLVLDHGVGGLDPAQ